MYAGQWKGATMRKIGRIRAPMWCTNSDAAESVLLPAKSVLSIDSRGKGHRRYRAVCDGFNVVGNGGDEWRGMKIDTSRTAKRRNGRRQGDTEISMRDRRKWVVTRALEKPSH